MASIVFDRHDMLNKIWLVATIWHSVSRGDQAGLRARQRAQRRGWGKSMSQYLIHRQSGLSVRAAAPTRAGVEYAPPEPLVASVHGRGGSCMCGTGARGRLGHTRQQCLDLCLRRRRGPEDADVRLGGRAQRLSSSGPGEPKRSRRARGRHPGKQIVPGQPAHQAGCLPRPALG